MSYCHNCMRDLGPWENRKTWRNCPHCGAPIPPEDRMPTQDTQPPVQTPPVQTPPVQTPPTQDTQPPVQAPPTQPASATPAPSMPSTKNIIMGCAGVAIGSACLLDWGQVMFLGSFKVWDFSTIARIFSSMGSYGSSSSQGTGMLIVTLLLLGIAGSAWVGYGIYDYYKKSDGPAAGTQLLRAAVLLGGDALMWIIVMWSMASSANSTVNSYTSYLTSSRVSVASVSAGPIIALIACVVVVYLLLKNRNAQA